MNKVDIDKASAITQKLHALLKAADFTLLESRRIIGGERQAVNEIMYMNGEGERVFIIAHEPPKGIPA